MWSLAPFNLSDNNFVDIDFKTPNVSSLQRVSSPTSNIYDRICMNDTALICVDTLGKLTKYNIINESFDWSVQSDSSDMGSGLYLDENYVITPYEVIDSKSGNIILNLFDESEYLKNLTEDSLSEYGMLFLHEREILRTSICKVGAKMMSFNLDSFDFNLKNLPFLPYCYSPEQKEFLGVTENNYLERYSINTESHTTNGQFSISPMFLVPYINDNLNLVLAIDPVNGVISLMKNGNEIWTRSAGELKGNCRHFSQMACLDDNRVIITVNDGYKNSLLSLDVESGLVQWELHDYIGEGFFSSKNSIYTVLKGGNPIILDKSSGDIMWRSSMEVPFSKVLASETHIAYLDYCLNAYIFELD
jgi:hypothetical protein